MCTWPLILLVTVSLKVVNLDKIDTSLTFVYMTAHTPGDRFTKDRKHRHRRKSYNRFTNEWHLQVMIKPPQYNWNIVESGIKHHNPNPHIRLGKISLLQFDFKKIILITPIHHVNYIVIESLIIPQVKLSLVYSKHKLLK